MIQMPDGTVSPYIPATPQGIPGGVGGQVFNGQGQFIQMVAAGPAKLDKTERRKLIKEIREEIKPLCSQIADF